MKKKSTDFTIFGTVNAFNTSVIEGKLNYLGGKEAQNREGVGGLIVKVIIIIIQINNNAPYNDFIVICFVVSINTIIIK